MRHTVVSLFLALSPLVVAMPNATAADQSVDKRALAGQFHDFDETMRRLDHAIGQLHHEVSRYETVDLGPDVLDDQIMNPWGATNPGMYPGATPLVFQNLVKGTRSAAAQALCGPRYGTDRTAGKAV